MNKTEIVKTILAYERQFGIVEALHRVFEKNIKIKIGYSIRDCNASIEDLALSVRSYNALRRTNIITIGDLIDRLNEGGLKTVRNLGTKSFSEIQAKIMVYGFEQLSEKEKLEFFYYLVENNAVH